MTPVIDFSKYPKIDPEEERKKSKPLDITRYPRGDSDPLRDSYQDVQGSSPDAIAKVNDRCAVSGEKALKLLNSSMNFTQFFHSLIIS